MFRWCTRHLRGGSLPFDSRGGKFADRASPFTTESEKHFLLISLWEIRSDFLLLLGSGRGWSESCTEASDNMFIGSTLGRIAVTRARAEAVIAQLDSRLKSSERELRTGLPTADRAAALTDE